MFKLKGVVSFELVDNKTGKIKKTLTDFNTDTLYGKFAVPTDLYFDFLFVNIEDFFNDNISNIDKVIWSKYNTIKSNFDFQGNNQFVHDSTNNKYTFDFTYVNNSFNSVYLYGMNSRDSNDKIVTLFYLNPPFEIEANTTMIGKYEIYYTPIMEIDDNTETDIELDGVNRFIGQVYFNKYLRNYKYSRVFVKTNVYYGADVTDNNYQTVLTGMAITSNDSDNRAFSNYPELKYRVDELFYKITADGTNNVAKAIRFMPYNDFQTDLNRNYIQYMFNELNCTLPVTSFLSYKDEDNDYLQGLVTHESFCTNNYDYIYKIKCTYDLSLVEYYGWKQRYVSSIKSIDNILKTNKLTGDVIEELDEIPVYPIKYNYLLNDIFTIDKLTNIFNGFDSKLVRFNNSSYFFSYGYWDSDPYITLYLYTRNSSPPTDVKVRLGSNIISGNFIESSSGINFKGTNWGDVYLYIHKFSFDLSSITGSGEGEFGIYVSDNVYGDLLITNIYHYVVPVYMMNLNGSELQSNYISSKLFKNTDIKNNVSLTYDDFENFTIIDNYSLSDNFNEYDFDKLSYPNDGLLYLKSSELNNKILFIKKGDIPSINYYSFVLDTGYWSGIYIYSSWLMVDDKIYPFKIFLYRNTVKNVGGLGPIVQMMVNKKLLEQTDTIFYNNDSIQIRHIIFGNNEIDYNYTNYYIPGNNLCFSVCMWDPNTGYKCLPDHNYNLVFFKQDGTDYIPVYLDLLCIEDIDRYTFINNILNNISGIEYIIPDTEAIGNLTINFDSGNNYKSGEFISFPIHERDDVIITDSLEDWELLEYKDISITDNSFVNIHDISNSIVSVIDSYKSKYVNLINQSKKLDNDILIPKNNLSFNYIKDRFILTYDIHFNSELIENSNDYENFFIYGKISKVLLEIPYEIEYDGNIYVTKIDECYITDGFRMIPWSVLLGKDYNDNISENFLLGDNGWIINIDTVYLRKYMGSKFQSQLLYAYVKGIDKNSLYPFTFKVYNQGKDSVAGGIYVDIKSFPFKLDKNIKITLASDDTQEIDFCFINEYEDEMNDVGSNTIAYKVPDIPGGNLIEYDCFKGDGFVYNYIYYNNYSFDTASPFTKNLILTDKIVLNPFIYNGYINDIRLSRIGVVNNGYTFLNRFHRMDFMDFGSKGDNSTEYVFIKDLYSSYRLVNNNNQLPTVQLFESYTELQIDLDTSQNCKSQDNIYNRVHDINSDLNIVNGTKDDLTIDYNSGQISFNKDNMGIVFDGFVNNSVLVISYRTRLNIACLYNNFPSDLSSVDRKYFTYHLNYVDNFYRPFRNNIYLSFIDNLLFSNLECYSGDSPNVLNSIVHPFISRNYSDFYKRDYSTHDYISYVNISRYSNINYRYISHRIHGISGWYESKMKALSPTDTAFGDKVCLYDYGEFYKLMVRKFNKYVYNNSFKFNIYRNIMDGFFDYNHYSCNIGNLLDVRLQDFSSNKYLYIHYLPIQLPISRVRYLHGIVPYKYNEDGVKQDIFSYFGESLNGIDIKSWYLNISDFTITSNTFKESDYIVPNINLDNLSQLTMIIGNDSIKYDKSKIYKGTYKSILNTDYSFKSNLLHEFLFHEGRLVDKTGNSTVNEVWFSPFYYDFNYVNDINKSIDLRNTEINISEGFNYDKMTIYLKRNNSYSNTIMYLKGSLSYLYIYSYNTILQVNGINIYDMGSVIHDILLIIDGSSLDVYNDWNFIGSFTIAELKNDIKYYNRIGNIFDGDSCFISKLCIFDKLFDSNDISELQNNTNWYVFGSGLNIENYLDFELSKNGYKDMTDNYLVDYKTVRNENRAFINNKLVTNRFYFDTGISSLPNQFSFTFKFNYYEIFREGLDKSVIISDGENCKYGLFIKEGGDLCIISNGNEYDFDTNLSTNTDYYITLTHDGNNTSIYINKNLVGSQAISFDGTLNETLKMFMLDKDMKYALGAYMENFRIWDKVLDQTEIDTLIDDDYNLGKVSPMINISVLRNYFGDNFSISGYNYWFVDENGNLSNTPTDYIVLKDNFVNFSLYNNIPDPCLDVWEHVIDYKDYNYEINSFYIPYKNDITDFNIFTVSNRLINRKYMKYGILPDTYHFGSYNMNIINVYSHKYYEPYREYYNDIMSSGRYVGNIDQGTYGIVPGNLPVAYFYSIFDGKDLFQYQLKTYIVNKEDSLNNLTDPIDVSFVKVENCEFTSVNRKLWSDIIWQTDTIQLNKVDYFGEMDVLEFTNKRDWLNYEFNRLMFFKVKDTDSGDEYYYIVNKYNMELEDVTNKFVNDSFKDDISRDYVYDISYKNLNTLTPFNNLLSIYTDDKYVFKLGFMWKITRTDDTNLNSSLYCQFYGISAYIIFNDDSLYKRLKWAYINDKFDTISDSNTGMSNIVIKPEYTTWMIFDFQTTSSPDSSVFNSFINPHLILDVPYDEIFDPNLSYHQLLEEQ